VLKHLGKVDEAVASYEQALRLRSDYPEAHNNLGLALASRGKLEAAVVSYQQAVRLKPDYAEACANMADALAGLCKLNEAAAGYAQALKLRPTDPRLHKCLGNALARMEKLADAEASYREAIRLAPTYADAINDLGIAHARQNRYDDAIAADRRAFEVKPSFVEALNNLGNALRSAGRFEESLECYRKALEQKPDYADAHNNLGIAYAEQGRFDEAVASYTECLKLRPTHVDAHMNRALTWLRKGDYAQGWAEYEWRWKKRSLTNRPLIMPQWNGFPLSGRRILLITEQGLGDTLQFVRFCNVLKRQGAGAVILECPEVLVPVLSRTPGIDHLVPQGQPLPDYDVYCPLMNVPGLTATSVESIPSEVPYITADPELLEPWRRELGGVPEFKVGINWQGNPKYAGDRHRSIPLASFEPLARVPGVRLYSIQQLHGLDQLEGLKGKFPVTHLGSRLNQTTGPFLDTAAAMMNLDLVISCDSSPAHLAGALGAPVWMAISSTPDWRWLSHREDTPWYPSMRIFRQNERFVWGPVFERMAAELRPLARERARLPSVTVRIRPGELIDRITTLQIRAERVADPSELGDIRAELTEMQGARDRAIPDTTGIEGLAAEMRAVNEVLWTIERRIGECERVGDFGAEFAELARSAHEYRGRGAAIGRRIDERLRAEVIEEKADAGSEPAGSLQAAQD
jgi:tetratricopeptide (TPR) repeat protein